MSKLSGKELVDNVQLGDSFADIRSMLEDKDCIIIGSPDVSDFAEQVLAKIHNIAPYAKDRIKRTGFVQIKGSRNSRSSFYWEKKKDEMEGVAQIINKSEYEYFPEQHADENLSEKKHQGQMHGILIVANNPFQRSSSGNKIIILSGFSGVATNAIALLLTHENCLEEFFKLDNAFTDLGQNIEALVRVRYTVGKNFAAQDTRKIKDYGTTISFERIVEI